MSTNEEPQGYGAGAYGEGPYGDESQFEVTIVGTNSPVPAGETVEVEVLVENTGGGGEQEITLGIEEA